MKVLKFGGTSVGSPERMRALIPLIRNSEQKIVVLSAMSGTTNSLVEISGLYYSGDASAALEKIDLLRAKYHKVVNELYSFEGTRQIGLDIINSHFDFIAGYADKPFSKI